MSARYIARAYCAESGKWVHTTEGNLALADSRASGLMSLVAYVDGKSSPAFAVVELALENDAGVSSVVRQWVSTAAGYHLVRGRGDSA
jgi:hypothetical protein